MNVTKLKRDFSVIVDGLAAEKDRLVKQRDGLDKEESRLTDWEKTLLKTEAELKALEATLKDVLEDKELKQTNIDQVKALRQRELGLNRRERGLKVKENELYDIHVKQKKMDKKLSARETKQARRERTYVKELKAKFADRLADSILLR